MNALHIIVTRNELEFGIDYRYKGNSLMSSRLRNDGERRMLEIVSEEINAILKNVYGVMADGSYKRGFRLQAEHYRSIELYLPTQFGLSAHEVAEIFDGKIGVSGINVQFN